MKYHAILTFIVLAVSSCAAQAPTQYFPYDALPRQSEQEKAYSDVMRRFSEHSLLQESKLTPNTRTYRLLWFGALAVESPIVIRLNVQDDGTGLLNLKIVNGRRRGQWGKITVKGRTISKKKMERFLTAVHKLDLSSEPTHDPTQTLGLDGSDWLLESVENGSYKVFRRWSSRKDAAHEMARMLSRLAGENFIR